MIASSKCVCVDIRGASCVVISIFRCEQWLMHSNVWLPLNPHENWSVYNLTREFPLARSKPVISLYTVVMWCACRLTHSEATHSDGSLADVCVLVFGPCSRLKGFASVLLFRNGMCSNMCTANDMGASLGLATYHQPLFCSFIEVCNWFGSWHKHDVLIISEYSKCSAV